MNDAEAEAVLLALGGVLKWVARGGGDESAYIKDGETYIIRQEKCRCLFWQWNWYRTVHSEVSPRAQPAHHHPPFIERKNESSAFYKSTTAAKAACERHYATGKWE